MAKTQNNQLIKWSPTNCFGMFDPYSIGATPTATIQIIIALSPSQKMMTDYSTPLVILASALKFTASSWAKVFSAAHGHYLASILAKEHFIRD